MSIMFILLLVLNFAISWLNARNTGKVWSESKTIGGMMRVSAVCGYVMAIAGFTMVYGCLLLLLTIALYPNIPYLYNNVELNQLIQLSSDMLYVLIVLAVIPTGLIIWLNSVVSFWKNKTFVGGAVAGYNTYAMAHNVINASRELPGAFGRIIEALFGGKGKKGNEVLIMAAIFIVIMALVSGWMTASAIMKRADREYDMLATVNS